MENEFYSLNDKDVWQTPQWLIDILTEEVTFRLGPCAGLFTFNAELNWTIEEPEIVPPQYTVRASDMNDGTICIENDGRELHCGVDALERPWDTGGLAWINPPFSLKNQFIDKAIESYENGGIDGAIILTPDSTDVKSWWHGKLANHSEYVWFSEGRISFIDPDTGESQNQPTFGTALHFVGGENTFPQSLFERLSDHGDMLQRL